MRLRVGPVGRRLGITVSDSCGGGQLGRTCTNRGIEQRVGACVLDGLSSMDEREEIKTITTWWYVSFGVEVIHTCVTEAVSVFGYCLAGDVLFLNYTVQRRYKSYPMSISEELCCRS